MIPLYSNSQIRSLDAFAIKQLQVPGIVLMENAAIGITQLILQRFPDVQNVGIICGKGNNGGDGFAVARHLSNEGLNVKIIYLGNIDEMSDDCRTNFLICNNLSQIRKNLKLIQYDNIKQIKLLSNSRIIIDAILGSGFSGELKEPVLSIVKELNNLKAHKIAIDVPTGLNADSGYGDVIFKSNLTITLGEFKKGLFVGKGYENCGEILLKEIGVGRDYFNNEIAAAHLIEPEDIFSYLPVRPKRINKYSAGKVLTIAGSYQYPGAAVLTAGSALYTGAGASVLAIPHTIKKFVHKKFTELVTLAYGNSESKNLTKADYNELSSRILWADVIALGPGIGRENDTMEFVQHLMKKRQFKFAVIDADALYAIKELLGKIKLDRCILTPHYGEFSNLTGIGVEELEKNILETGKEFAKQYKTTLILKGAPTVSFFPDGEVIINSSGNSGLAKFGSGDVLTGMIAALVAQLKDIRKSVLSAVYLHGLSADLLVNSRTEYGLLASDVMKNIPSTIRFLKRSFES